MVGGTMNPAAILFYIVYGIGLGVLSGWLVWGL
jgi:hypothetical protein